jgi:hypothetical protein
MLKDSESQITLNGEPYWRFRVLGSEVERFKGFRGSKVLGSGLGGSEVQITLNL